VGSVLAACLVLVVAASQGAAPNGATLAGSVTITNITVVTNALNTRVSLPANPRRIGLILQDITTAGAGMSNIVWDVQSNQTFAASVFVIPVLGATTNAWPGLIYQGQIWFMTATTNSSTSTGQPTNTVRCIEFIAAP